jgi:proteic killer suppression protein
LFALHHAEDPDDLKDLNRLHFLHGNYEGFFAVNVSGSWRIIGRFIGKDVELVDYLDYH